MTRVSIIGFPSSAGSYAAGQDLAPMALRNAGLVQSLSGAGHEATDRGDLLEQVWHPDRDHPRAQNAAEVVEGLRQLTEALRAPLVEDDVVLVLGGNCTVTLAVMAALAELSSDPPGLAYVDRHFDLNTPESTTDGALDWMGLGHALDLPGSLDELAGAFGARPLMEASQVAWLGVDAALARDWEREQASRLELVVQSLAELAADPQHAAATALAALPRGPLAVHLDVDVLDFTDAPLAENTDGRNSGPTLDQLEAALLRLSSDPRFRVLSIGELNPTRSAGDPDAIPRFVKTIAKALAQSQRT